MVIRPVAEPRSRKGFKQVRRQAAVSRRRQTTLVGSAGETRSCRMELRRNKKRLGKLPTLPQECSTIGVRALDFRVRDGNGYYHSAMATKPAFNPNPEVSLGSPLKAFRYVPGCD